MGELKTLRKENLKLKEDLAAVNDEVQNLKTLLKQQRLQSEIECVGEPTKTYVAGIQKSVDFLSEDHHNAKEFREKTLQELGKLSHKLAEISSKADNMAAAIDDLQKYSFQYNVKIVGIPNLQESHESAEATAELCVKLFHAMGATGVTANDIDIAHRVSTRRSDGHYAKPIVCKFVRRLAREEVMKRRRDISKVNPATLGLRPEFKMDDIRVYEHLTPNLQQLLSEANKLKTLHQFQFIWVKNLDILARKTSSSQVFKFKCMADLDKLKRSLDGQLTPE